MNRKGTGLVHIYFGDGKGKTTTGMGLCVRAAGYGYRVLIYQFMKNNKTSERNILEKIENVSIVNGLDQEKFSFQMTEQEKKERLAFYNSQFEKKTSMCFFWMRRSIRSVRDCWMKSWYLTF